MSLLGRARVEARYAATLIRAAGPGALTTPPHRYLGVARAYAAGGPVGAATAFGAAAHGTRAAIIDERGQVTFRDLDTRTTALAAALSARGVAAGAGIGILCRNHRGFVEAFFAAGKLGARTVLLNTDFSAPQLADVCTREGISLLIHDEEFTGIAARALPAASRAVAWSDGAPDTDTLNELIVAGPALPSRRPAQGQQVVLLTSGTTGTPKGAPRDIPPTLAGPGSILSRIPIRSNRAIFVAAPIFHAWGLAGTLMGYGLGNTIVMMRRFDPAATIAALEKHRCDALVTVPILLSRLVTAGAEDIGRRNLSTLRIVALSGSSLSPELAARATELLGDVIYNLYGSTEVGYAAIATPADLRAAPGTVGKPPFGTTVKLLDADGREVPRGQRGRIFVGNGFEFGGYTGGGTKETIDGLMSTGDVGHFDRAGRLFVDGRADDMIVSGGENVFPREIEELLTARPDIADAAVIGVDDAEFGQRLRAYVVPADGADLDPDVVRDHVKANLARYKVPRDVVFVAEIPRNPAGKIVKRLLPEL